MAKMMIFILRCYQYCVSPLFANRCRFYPSCSEYAIDAIAQHGLLKGFFLAIRRLLKCHPACVGFYDPVPPK